MRKTPALTLFLCLANLAAQPGQARAPYFPAPADQPQRICLDRQRIPPARVVAVDQYSAEWFSSHLAAAGEPSLYRPPARAAPPAEGALRFTWLRSFHHPVIIRVAWWRSSGPRLIATELSGAGGYTPGSVRRRIDRPLTRKEAALIRGVLVRTHALALPTVECGIGLDGAEWIVESATGAGYRALVRWSPDSGGIRTLGLTMLRLTGWRFGEIY